MCVCVYTCSKGERDRQRNIYFLNLLAVNLLAVSRKLQGKAPVTISALSFSIKDSKKNQKQDKRKQINGCFIISVELSDKNDQTSH